MIKVKERRFALQSKLVEVCQTVKGENCLWSIECRRKPPCAKELRTLMYHMSTLAAVAEVNGDVMDATGIED